ncbi:hypothetical protein [Flammeovirga sp. SJP92]|uniref:hypothetical protein n=1 Tax=Flammeovirga sp. SJP92 TaxID=1775430 RepID=UPI000788E582|nr:hypothetical protein [Flammeovirga sp. SJP92]KXX71779.1 hypothetical protein AVL50_03065 [Flammeovirga sp. SJP92]
MTDIEYDILDELYFVVSFKDLLSEVSLQEETLKTTLKSLIEKGWVRSFSSPSEEIEIELSDFENLYSSLYYLASKKGLLAHNSQ